MLIMPYLISICFLLMTVLSEEASCSISIVSTDERSCDYGKSQDEPIESRTPQVEKPTTPHVESRTPQVGRYRTTKRKHRVWTEITWEQYQRGVEDAKARNFELAIPILRKATEKWKTPDVYNNLCAFLMDWGHRHKVDEAKKLYDEAEENCNLAISIDNSMSDAVENLKGLKKSREIRGMISAPAGRFVGERKKKPKADKKKKQKQKKMAMGFNDVYSQLEEPLRIFPGKMDDGNLEFKLYNGSSVDPRPLTVQRGEVYVEDDFVSKSERLSLMAISERGVLEETESLQRGPKGAVLSGKLLSMAAHLTSEEKNLIARIRERVVNRANDFRALDTPMYSYVNGVRAHATAILRYRKEGRHNVHHDNDFLNRCLTASIILNDGFEGGDLNLHTTKNVNDRTLKGFPIIGSVKGKAGRLLMFLAQSMNSVSEITSGTRDTLFVWLTCDVEAEYQLDHPLELVDDRKVWKASV